MHRPAIAATTPRRVSVPAVALALLVWLCVCRGSSAAAAQSPASAQIGGNTTGNAANRSPGYTPFGDQSREDEDQNMQHVLARARESERQKRMVDDASRLVTLAARYRASVAEHGKPTSDDERMLLDMEKLARSIKDRMKGM